VVRPLVPDTTTLIDTIRHPEQWPTFERHVRTGRLWLSSVVAAELLAGTRDSAEAQWIERLVSGMRQTPPAGRVLTPDLVDWTRSGRLIADAGDQMCLRSDSVKRRRRGST